MKKLPNWFDILKNEKFTGLSIILITLTAYQLVYFNRYFPIQEGWFSVYAHEMLNGKMPYRDFYLFVQPLFLWKTAAIVNIFGYDFIALRIVGIIERLILASTIYLIYLKFFKVRHCVIITLTTIVLFSNNSTDVINSYLQTCLIFSLLSTYLIINYVSRREDKNSFIWIISSGFFASLSFLTKQSTGLLILLVIPAIVLIIYFKRENIKKNLLFFYCYSLGASIPFLFIINWLCFNGAFFDYLNQVFLGGISSKGSLISIIFGFYERAFLLKYLIPFGILVIVFIVANKKGNKTDQEFFKDRQYVPMFLIALVFCISFIIPYLYLNYFINIYLNINYFELKQFLARSSLYFSIILSVYCFSKVIFKNEDSIKNIQLFIVSSICFTIMYSYGLSFTIDEQATVPSLGLMLGILFNSITPYNKIKNYILYILCFLIISLCATQQYTVPYQWWGWGEPDIKHATVEPSIPDLKYFRLSPSTTDVITDITSTIIENTNDGDNIFTFPSIPLFYLLSDRYPNTFALVHYFDVCPDSYAIADSEMILKSPPKVIINFEFPETAWYFHEEHFRSGNPSGQRKIRSAINQLVTSGKYDLKRTYKTSIDGYELEIWVKKY